MAKLSVNVNKIALIRNARGKNLPNLEKTSKDILDFGAHGITIHPRPDQRHIRTDDLPLLKGLVVKHNEQKNSRAELNIEGYPSEAFLTSLEHCRPHQATLVPDPPEALTSNAGWDFISQQKLLAEVCERLKSQNIRVSLFLEPDMMDTNQWNALSKIPCDRVELYTEKYADSFTTPQRSKVLDEYKACADKAAQLNLGVNAGHDLNLENLSDLIRHIPQIEEVSIGHALISEAIYLGLKETLSRYIEILKASHGN